MAAQSRKGEGPKTGPFAQGAEIIRECGAFPIPCGKADGKVPLVKWEHFKFLPNRKTMGEWGVRFAGANVGILCQPSKITVVDVDDADLLPDALAEHGDTPLIIRTPRDGFHLYYRSSGEATITRKDGAPIDVRGVGGYVVAPPSRRPEGGDYAFQVGSWRDLNKLPTARPGSLPFAQSPPKPRTVEAGGKVTEGARNDTLFRELLRVAVQCDTKDELSFRAAGFNEAILDPPLSDGEVSTIVGSVWRYREEGRLWVGGEARAIFTRSEVLTLADESDAMVLLAVLRLEFEGRGDTTAFSISPKAMAKHGVLPGWTVYRYRTARDALLKIGEIQCVHEGGRHEGDHSLYRLGVGQKTAPYTTRHAPQFTGWHPRTVPPSEVGTVELPALPLFFGEVLPPLVSPVEALRQSLRTHLATAPRGEQSRLAERLGLTRFEVSNFKSGRHRLNPPAEATLRALLSGGGAP